ncbi:hypothetical protein ACFQ4C_21315 [Larkinella insperata]|uniref:Uncharacterized protein n=1 Tax=Larkinella insperata TaxID=332158 RepID=A0ABW3QBI6_9BACT
MTINQNKNRFGPVIDADHLRRRFPNGQGVFNTVFEDVLFQLLLLIRGQRRDQVLQNVQDRELAFNIFF